MEIPGYTIKRMLGKGGMASVYLAVQDKFDRDVALKVSTERFSERFEKEADNAFILMSALIGKKVTYGLIVE